MTGEFDRLRYVLADHRDKVYLATSNKDEKERPADNHGQIIVITFQQVYGLIDSGTNY